MRIRYTYPVSGNLLLTEHWPVKVGEIELVWVVQEQRVMALQATAPLGAADVPPSIKEAPKPGVSLHVDLGRTAKHEQIESAVRTVWGLVSLYATIDLHVEELQREWIPESEEEKNSLKLGRFSSRITRHEDKPSLLGFDLVARAMLCAISLSDYEVPLGFLRRGTRAMRDGEYVSAFYNYFFFLETLYAPGFSSPSIVKAKLWAAKEVRDAVPIMRATLHSKECRDAEKGAKILALTDEKLIEHLVDVRGDLHHHSRRRPGAWHPDKQSAYQEEALILGDIVHIIARDQALAPMFDDARSNELMNSAAAADATSRIRIRAFIQSAEGEQELQPVVITVPAREISAASISSTHRFFREKYKDTREDVVRYELVSYDGETLYASWRKASGAAPK